MLSKLMSEKKKEKQKKKSDLYNYPLVVVMIPCIDHRSIDPSSSHVFKWFVDTYRLI